MGRFAPARFERVAAAFDADVARKGSCESSGSEHLAESSTDLSDLVKSFMEREEGEEHVKNDDMESKDQDDDHQEESDQKCEWFDSENKEKLLRLLAKIDDEGEDEWNVKGKIREEVAVAYDLVTDKSSHGLKRRLMSRLRDRGLDAGLCKSKWDKKGRFPAGDYDYVDLNYNGKRYVVEVSLAREFEIARPTTQYSSLLEAFPLIYVGKVDELKKIVILMSRAMKESMRSVGLHVPPWRKNGYMQTKWFNSYKRTTNETATIRASILSAEAAKRWIGFDHQTLHVAKYNCKETYYAVKKVGLRVGCLSSELNSINGVGMQS